jgi:hypothetical protein
MAAVMDQGWEECACSRSVYVENQKQMLHTLPVVPKNIVILPFVKYLGQGGFSAMSHDLQYYNLQNCKLQTLRQLLQTP